MRTILTLTLLLAGTLQAAPVPKNPPKVEHEHLNGTTWTYQYGDQIGFISFNNDGTYFSKHSPNNTTGNCGNWYVDQQGVIHLKERSWCHKTGTGDYISNFKFKLNTKHYPTLEGNSASTYVKLSERKYHQP